MQSLSGFNQDKSILERISDGLISIHENGKLQYINGQAKTLLNIIEQDISSEHTMEDLLEEASARFLRRKISEATLQQQSLCFEMELKEPAAKWLDVHIYPGADGATIIMREMTARKQTSFLSMMSHELRTPLNSIIGFAQILGEDANEPLTYRQNEKVAKILNSSRHLLNLINDLLDHVKTEAGKPILKYEPLRVEGFIQQTLKMILPQAKGKKIRIYDQTQSCSHIHVSGDLTRINQVLLNLLENAVKYTEAGGRIIIAAETENHSLKISVTDNGLGIPHHEHKQIFEPFYRIPHLEKNIEGTGIGLTLVKQLVNQMGGNIGLNSAPGSGSCFWFTLPISREAFSVSEEYVSPNCEAANFSSLSGKVLYIDDNRNDLTLLEVIFEEQRNVQFISSADAKEGIELAAEYVPDLILLDIHMPGFQGYDVVKQLKNDNATCDIPIIAISADASTETIHKAMKSGFSEYITKPLDLKTLLKKIGEYL